VADFDRLVTPTAQLTTAELTRLGDLHLDAFTVFYNAAKLKKSQAAARLRAELASIDVLAGYRFQRSDSPEDVTTDEDRPAW